MNAPTIETINAGRLLECKVNALCGLGAHAPLQYRVIDRGDQDA